MAEPERRRRRLRPPSAAPVPGPPPAAFDPAAVGENVPAGIEDPAEEPARPARRLRPTSGAGASGDEGERGLRGLVGSGSSQVSVDAALRARDAARPTEAHLAEADANLPIIRRNWAPREDLPRQG